VNLDVGRGFWMLRKPLARKDADRHDRQMVVFRPVERRLDEPARDAVAGQFVRDARVYEEQTIASASIGKLGLRAVLLPDQTVVGSVAHDRLMRGIDCHRLTLRHAGGARLRAPTTV
jgi:hypothetical protein